MGLRTMWIKLKHGDRELAPDILRQLLKSDAAVKTQHVPVQAAKPAATSGKPAAAATAATAAPTTTAPAAATPAATTTATAAPPAKRRKLYQPSSMPMVTVEVESIPSNSLRGVYVGQPPITRRYSTRVKPSSYPVCMSGTGTGTGTN